jgi:uncharacterized protein
METKQMTNSVKFPSGSRVKKKRLIERLTNKAAAGDLVSITKLAEIYGDRKGSTADRKKLQYFLEKGVKLGDAYLTWCLADATYHGDGVEKSEVKGLKLLRKAALLGVAEAYTALGVHWFEKGGTSGRTRAKHYYLKAADLNEPHALHNLGLMASNNKMLSDRLNVAHTFFTKAAKLGHAEAQFKVGWSLLFGEGVPKNAKSANSWLRKAAAQKHRGALNLLARNSASLEFKGRAKKH